MEENKIKCLVINEAFSISINDQVYPDDLARIVRISEEKENGEMAQVPIYFIWIKHNRKLNKDGRMYEILWEKINRNFMSKVE